MKKTSTLQDLLLLLEREEQQYRQFKEDCKKISTLVSEPEMTAEACEECDQVINGNKWDVCSECEMVFCRDCAELHLWVAPIKGDFLGARMCGNCVVDAFADAEEGSDVEEGEEYVPSDCSDDD